jgi:hypothetical protein
VDGDIVVRDMIVGGRLNGRCCGCVDVCSPDGCLAVLPRHSVAVLSRFAGISIYHGPKDIPLRLAGVVQVPLKCPNCLQVSPQVFQVTTTPSRDACRELGNAAIFRPLLTTLPSSVLPVFYAQPFGLCV